MTCIAVLQNAAAFHITRSSLSMVVTNDEVFPSIKYLWSALVFGWLINVLFYFLCGLHGQFLIAFGMPLAAIAARGLLHWWRNYRPWKSWEHLRLGFEDVNDTRSLTVELLESMRDTHQGGVDKPPRYQCGDQYVPPVAPES